jgi:repressor LexA
MTTVPLTRRQREILDFIESYRAKHRMSPTLEEIAQQLGVNKVTIFGHVSELERKGVLTRAGRGISRSLRITTEREDVANTTIPLLGTIAAGLPIEAVEEAEQLDLVEMFPNQDDVYALRVGGDSMIEDAICDGDVVIVARNRTARDGDIVVAVLPGEVATLKRCYREGASVRLQPANAAFVPVVVNDLEIRGVVIGVVRRF